MDDMRKTMLPASNGTPLLLGDVATVTVGHAPRLGIAGRDDDDDIVQGIVLMRRGERSLPTLGRVEAEVEKINSGGLLPPGARVEKIYDRRDPITVPTTTALHNMLLGVALLFLDRRAF